MNQRISIALLALYWIAMVVGTHIPADYVPPTFSWVDKVYHCITYAGLAVLVVNVFGFRSVAKFQTPVVGGLMVLLMLHGAIDEVTQSFIPGRCPSIADWIADSLGGAFGIAACWCWSKTGSLRRSRLSRACQEIA